MNLQEFRKSRGLSRGELAAAGAGCGPERAVSRRELTLRIALIEARCGCEWERKMGLRALTDVLPPAVLETEQAILDEATAAELRGEGHEVDADDVRDARESSERAERRGDDRG